MPTGTMNMTLSAGGITIQGLASRTAEGQISQEVSLPAAEAGTLSTRTADDEGTFTIAGHGFVVGDILDVYWSGGVRYGMKVTAVSGNDVTAGGVTGPGAGDVLPAASTAVAVDEQVVINTDFDGDNVRIIALQSTRTGHFDFQDVGSASLHAASLTASEPWWWVSGTGVSNPLAGNPVI